MFRLFITSCLLAAAFADHHGKHGKTTYNPFPVYNAIFDSFDANNNGLLDKAEFDGFFKNVETAQDKDGYIKQALGFGDSNAAAFLQLLDVNGDQKVDLTDSDGIYQGMDKNDDDSVTKMEFGNAFHLMIRKTPFVALYRGAVAATMQANVPFAAIQAVLNTLDVNKDGKIQPNELRLALDGPQGLDFDVIAHAYVDNLDTDGDGALGPADVMAFANALDGNSDGMLNFSEILAVGDLLDKNARKKMGSL